MFMGVFFFEGKKEFKERYILVYIGYIKFIKVYIKFSFFYNIVVDGKVIFVYWF